MITTDTNTLIRSHMIALALFDANNKCMTVNECASFLGVHPKTVKNRIQSEKIQANLIGTIWRIPKIQFIDDIIKGLNPNV